jgi:DNA replication protein DnaC
VGIRTEVPPSNRLPYAQFLELLFQDEINVRHQRLINRRQKLADFRELRSLDNFEFSFNPGINRAQAFGPGYSGGNNTFLEAARPSKKGE